MAGVPGWPSFPVRIAVEDGKGVRRLDYNGHRPLWFGSDPGCDVPLLTPRSSARHACVVFEGGKLMLRDGESQHGTLLNDAKVLRAELHEGDVIRIGAAKIVIQHRPEPAPPVAIQKDGNDAEAPEEDAEDAAGEATAAPRRPDRRRLQRRGIAKAARAVKSPSSGRRKKPPIAIVVAIGVALVVVTVSAFVLLPDLWKEKKTAIVAAPGPAETPASPVVDPAAAADPGALASGVPVPAPALAAAPDSASTTAAVRRAEVTPDELLAELTRKAEKGDLGWGMIDQLESFLKSYPEHEAQGEVRKRIALLTGTRTGAAKSSRLEAGRVIDKLTADGRYGDAAAAARFLAGAGEDADSRSYWEKKAKDIEGTARTRFKALEEEINGLLEKGKAGDALRSLAAARRQFATLKFYESLLDPRIDAALAPPMKPEERPPPPQALQLKDRAGVAFDECDFHKLSDIIQSLLALGPPPDERLRLLESLVEAHHLARMLEDFLALVSKSPVEVSSLNGYPGRVIRADLKEYEYELDVGGRKGAAKSKQPWSRLTPAAKLALFDGIPGPSMSREGLLGLAGLAFRAGDEEAGQRAMLRLWKRADSQDLASAALARHLGISVPNGGFIELEGKLLTPDAKAAELARRKKAEDEDKLARAELQKAKKDTRVTSFIEQAKRLRQQGSFTVAQALLAEVAKRFPNTPPGKEALSLLEDPILSLHALVQNGPSKNRLDFYFLGDGYPAEDGYQSAFMASANTAMKLLLKEEPFKEYASYLNFFAVELASKDRGVNHLPGAQDKDTPVGGKVAYDVFTADRGKAMALIQRASKGTADGQAIVIGNDFAGVSTGGGGVSSVCKASLNALAHEIGHALGGLHDEYDFEPGNDPNRKAVAKRDPNCAVSPMPPNLMAGPNKDDVLKSVIWKNWLDAGPDRWWNGSKVSAFEGGERQLYNFWRPQSSCKMRDSTAFCVVCMEVMVKAFYRRVRPIDRADPEEKEVLLANDEEREVKIWPMKPETHLLEVKWFLQQLPDEDKSKKGPTIVVEKHDEELHKSFGRRVDPDGRVVDFAILRAKDLSRSKRFKLRVDVHDPTPWVLRDADGLLTETREWLVKIGSK